MSARAILIRYTAFAIVAIVVNLLTQRAVLGFGETPAYFASALVAGTLAGLVLKYVLDKFWIFEDAAVGLSHDGRQFALYSLMGLATTAIFWVTETLFWLTWRTDLMREVGAVIGLGAGYYIKYHLDRRFVFAASNSQRAGP